MSTPADIRAWMMAVLAEKGWTASEWAKRAKVATSTVAKALKPDYPFVTSTRTLSSLAQAADIPLPGTIATGRQAQMVPAFLPVRFRVQAGHWAEADAFAQTFVEDASYPVSPDPRYADWPQWLELVVGDSVNRLIPDGGLAHIVDAIEMGYAPRPDDFVVVERRRSGGSLRERTIKQVKYSPDGQIELWPCSTNPLWASPVQLRRGANDNEDLEVEIVGLVIGSYQKI